MSGIPTPVQDDYTRGKGMAAISVLTHLLRTLVANNALSRSEARNLLDAAMSPFIHANPTDIESMAAATITPLKEKSVPLSP